MYECENGECSKYIFANIQRIASVKSEDTNYYHSDHLATNSVITKADSSVGQEIYYYPYGELKESTGTIDVRHKYTDKEWDAETGLYYFGARYYDPKLAKFVSADTIVPLPFHPQTFNRYSYTYNNPLVFRDLEGHCPVLTTDCTTTSNQTHQTSNNSPPVSPVKQAQDYANDKQSDTPTKGPLTGDNGGGGPLKDPSGAILGGDGSIAKRFGTIDIPNLPDYAKNNDTDFSGPKCPDGEWTGYGINFEGNVLLHGGDLTFMKFVCLSDPSLVVHDFSFTRSGGLVFGGGISGVAIFVENAPSANDVPTQSMIGITAGNLKIGPGGGVAVGKNSLTVNAGFGVAAGVKTYFNNSPSNRTFSRSISHGE